MESKKKGLIYDVKKFIESGNIYYNDCQSEIQNKNFIVLKGLCRLAVPLLMIYMVIMWFIFKNTTLMIMYAVVLVLMSALTIMVKMYDNVENKRFGYVQGMSVAFDCIIGLFIMIVSLFPFTSQSGQFFPVFLIFIPSLFIFPLLHTYVSLFGTELIYVILVYNFKTGVRLEDTVISSTAMLLSMIFIFVIYDLRIHDNRINQQIVANSAIDQLTGLTNKSTTEYLCTEYFKHLSGDERCALFVLDLDNFKSVNDTYGHKTGDRVLEQVGEKLKAMCDIGDVVGRIGGDEFVILAKNINSRQEVIRRGKNVIDEFMNMNFDFNTDIKIKFSMGISIGYVEETYEDVFERADFNLYKSKNRGKNQIAVDED